MVGENPTPTRRACRSSDPGTSFVRVVHPVIMARRTVPPSAGRRWHLAVASSGNGFCRLPSRSLVAGRVRLAVTSGFDAPFRRAPESLVSPAGVIMSRWAVLSVLPRASAVVMQARYRVSWNGTSAMRSVGTRGMSSWGVDVRIPECFLAWARSVVKSRAIRPPPRDSADTLAQGRQRVRPSFCAWRSTHDGTRSCE